MQTTPRFEKTVNHAKESLPRLGHSHISSGHLVLGLLVLGTGVAPTVLRKVGLSRESVESYLSSRHSPVASGSGNEQLTLSESALAAFQRGAIEAQKRQHTYVGIEHLLLAILMEENGEAADLFASLHVDKELMRQTIADEIRTEL